MLKETIGLLISGVGLGFAVSGIKNEVIWLIAVGFIAFYVGLRIGVGVLIDRKIRESRIQDKQG